MSSPSYFMLQSLVGLVGVVVTAFGAVVAVSYANRTRWAGIVAAGFGLQVVGMLASQFMVPLLVRAGAGDPLGLARGALAISVVGVIARIVVVGGIVGLFADFVRAKRTLGSGNLGGAV